MPHYRFRQFYLPQLSVLGLYHARYFADVWVLRAISGLMHFIAVKGLIFFSHQVRKSHIQAHRPLERILSSYLFVPDWSWHFTYFNSCLAFRTINIFPDLFNLEKQDIDLPWAQSSDTIQLGIERLYHSCLALFAEIKFLELYGIGGLNEDDNEYSGHSVLLTLPTQNSSRL